ncbi:MAG: glycosyltransferase family 39 protein, partial [Chloroflexi bacterium]|nr:glycosyltransferase family 39 protein [Chloroflexota bacterium]
MTEETPNQTSEKEPTVLDLYKSVTKDWASFFNFIQSVWDARRREEFNQALAYEAARQVVVEETIEPTRAITFPWRAVLALILALLAQALVEPPLRLGMISVTIYLAAFGVAVWSYRSNEWHLPALPAVWQASDPLTMRLVPLTLAVIVAVIAFLDFGSGKFSWLNVTLWVISIVLLAYSLWVPSPKIQREASPNRWVWIVIVLTAFGITVFFRFYQLDRVPIEPFSDHAEKILDVYEITQGKPMIFFERNTGREAFQMYWTLLVLNIFGTGFSFLSLKLGTVLIGILTIPFIYMLGKEYGNERVALFALFLFGVASWPNIISRIGLRFPLYPLFAAPTLLYLTRGLRTHNRNDFILAGIFLGLGLHGYSPSRIVPILVLAAFGLYYLHAGTKENRQQAIFWLLLVVIVSVFVFSPLLRYWVGHPDQFGYRAFTRLSSLESPLPGPAWQIFLSNMYKGLLMFNWDDGEIQTHSVLHRPALDLITAALFMLGILFLIVRYIRQRDWRDMLLLVSIPILILPSVLSLAFPNENPAMNRAGGASVVVFVIGALALDGLVSSFGSELKRKVIAYSMVGLLFAGVAYSNYDLVFNQFGPAFSLTSWNSSEMGAVITDFENKYGQTDTVWIVPYPYWVDTRLPGVWAGIPSRD